VPDALKLVMRSAWCDPSSLRRRIRAKTCGLHGDGVGLGGAPKDISHDIRCSRLGSAAMATGKVPAATFTDLIDI